MLRNMTPPRGIASLQTADDLRNKLRRDLERLRKDHMDVDAAFDFFVTAHHLVDWWMPGRELRDARSRFYERQPLILACKDLANRAKHLMLTDPKSKTERPGAAEIRELAGAYDQGFSRGFDIRRIDAQESNRTTGMPIRAPVDVVQFAARVMAFWDQQDLGRNWSPPRLNAPPYRRLRPRPERPSRPRFHHAGAPRWSGWSWTCGASLRQPR